MMLGLDGFVYFLSAVQQVCACVCVFFVQILLLYACNHHIARVWLQKHHVV